MQRSEGKNQSKKLKPIIFKWLTSFPDYMQEIKYEKLEEAQKRWVLSKNQIMLDLLYSCQ